MASASLFIGAFNDGAGAAASTTSCTGGCAPARRALLAQRMVSTCSAVVQLVEVDRGTLTALALVPQVLKTWRTRSAADL